MKEDAQAALWVKLLMDALEELVEERNWPINIERHKYQWVIFIL